MSTNMTSGQLAARTSELRHALSYANDTAVTEVDALLAVAVALIELRAEVRQVGETLLSGKRR